MQLSGNYWSVGELQTDFSSSDPCPLKTTCYHLLSMAFQCFVSVRRGSSLCVSSQYSQPDGSDSTIKEVSLFEAGLSPRVRSESHPHPTSFASMVS
jgi:hypothetical protein